MSIVAIWGLASGEAFAIEASASVESCGERAPFAFAVDLLAGDARWCFSMPGNVDRTAVHSTLVPVEVREAAALWLPTWSGNLLAFECRDQGESLIPQNFPTGNDVTFLEGVYLNLLGRTATVHDRRQFADAMRAKIKELAEVDS